MEDSVEKHIMEWVVNAERIILNNMVRVVAQCILFQ